MLAILFVVTAASVPAARAQGRPPLYVQFDPYTVKGALYRPDSGDEPAVGVLLIHRVNNYLGHLAASELARRGFLVLAMNSRFDNNEAAVLWEHIALDVKTGVEFLKRQGGVRKVVLFGHSGGAATLSFYQAVAEKGTSYCDAPGKLTVCGKDLGNLPRADGLILVDASLGNPVGLLRSLNPAVVTEGDPKAINPALDPFNPANGFNPAGSTYTTEFKQKYYEAQAARMNRLVAAAVAQASNLGSERGPFPDDNVFLIVRGQGARLADAETLAETATAQPAQAPQEQWLDRDPDREERAAAGPTESGAERHLRRRRAPAHAQVVPHRQRDSIDQLDDRRRVVLEQQLDAVRARADRRPAPRLGHGRQYGPARQRMAVRDGRQPRQGLLRPRRRHPQHRPLRRVRDAQGRVRQQRQELLQLRARLDERTVLALTDGRAGECYCFRSEICAAVGKSAGTFCVTAPVAAHSVPRWSDTM